MVFLVLWLTSVSLIPSRSIHVAANSIVSFLFMDEYGFRKGRGTTDQFANIHWIVEKAREFQKNICFIDYTKAFDCVLSC